MGKYKSQRIGVALWLLGTVTSCSVETNEPNEPYELQGQLTVQTWWSQDQEQEAYDALFTEFGTHYPKVQIVTSQGPSAEESRKIFQERMTSGQPSYDTFQVVPASPYVASELANLDALAAREGFEDAFGDDVLSPFVL